MAKTGFEYLQSKGAEVTQNESGGAQVEFVSYGSAKKVAGLAYGNKWRSHIETTGLSEYRVTLPDLDNLTLPKLGDLANAIKDSHESEAKNRVAEVRNTKVSSLKRIFGADAVTAGAAGVTLKVPYYIASEDIARAFNEGKGGFNKNDILPAKAFSGEVVLAGNEIDFIDGAKIAAVGTMVDEARVRAEKKEGAALKLRDERIALLEEGLKDHAKINVDARHKRIDIIFNDVGADDMKYLHDAVDIRENFIRKEYNVKNAEVRDQSRTLTIIDMDKFVDDDAKRLVAKFNQIQATAGKREYYIEKLLKGADVDYERLGSEFRLTQGFADSNEAAKVANVLNGKLKGLASVRNVDEQFYVYLDEKKLAFSKAVPELKFKDVNVIADAIERATPAIVPPTIELAPAKIAVADPIVPPPPALPEPVQVAQGESPSKPAEIPVIPVSLGRPAPLENPAPAFKPSTPTAPKNSGPAGGKQPPVDGSTLQKIGAVVAPGLTATGTMIAGVAQSIGSRKSKVGVPVVPAAKAEDKKEPQSTSPAAEEDKTVQPDQKERNKDEWMAKLHPLVEANAAAAIAKGKDDKEKKLLEKGKEKYLEHLSDYFGKNEEAFDAKGNPNLRGYNEYLAKKGKEGAAKDKTNKKDKPKNEYEQAAAFGRHLQGVTPPAEQKERTTTQAALDYLPWIATGVAILGGLLLGGGGVEGLLLAGILGAVAFFAAPSIGNWIKGMTEPAPAHTPSASTETTKADTPTKVQEKGAGETKPNQTKQTALNSEFEEGIKIMEAQMRLADKNRDGYLSKEEYLAIRPDNAHVFDAHLKIARADGVKTSENAMHIGDLVNEIRKNVAKNSKNQVPEVPVKQEEKKAQPPAQQQPVEDKKDTAAKEDEKAPVKKVSLPKKLTTKTTVQGQKTAVNWAPADWGLDANKDGKIVQEEVSGFANRIVNTDFYDAQFGDPKRKEEALARLSKIDLNRDGKIDATDIEQIRAKIGAPYDAQFLARITDALQGFEGKAFQVMTPKNAPEAPPMSPVVKVDTKLNKGQSSELS